MWLIFGVTIGICERWLGSTFQGNPVSPGTVSSLRPFFTMAWNKPIVLLRCCILSPRDAKKVGQFLILWLALWINDAKSATILSLKLQDSPQTLLLQNINVRVSKFRVHWVFYLSSPLSPRAYELQPFSPWHLANYWEGDICYMRIFQYRPSKLK